MDDATSEIEQALREPEITAFDVADDEVVWSANNNGELDDLIAAELGYDTATEAFTGLGPALRFEDVSEEELASEQLDGDSGALAALINAPPPTVSTCSRSRTTKPWSSCSRQANWMRS